MSIYVNGKEKDHFYFHGQKWVEAFSELRDNYTHIMPDTTIFSSQNLISIVGTEISSAGEATKIMNAGISDNGIWLYVHLNYVSSIGSGDFYVHI